MKWLYTILQWMATAGQQGVQMNVSKLVSTTGGLFSNCMHSWPPFGGPWGPASVWGVDLSKKSLRMGGKGKTGTSVLILLCILIDPCLLCQVTLPVPVPVAPGTVFCATQSCKRAKKKKFSQIWIIVDYKQTCRCGSNSWNWPMCHHQTYFHCHQSPWDCCLD